MIYKDTFCLSTFQFEVESDNVIYMYKSKDRYIIVNAHMISGIRSSWFVPCKFNNLSIIIKP